MLTLAMTVLEAKTALVDEYLGSRAETLIEEEGIKSDPLSAAGNRNLR